MNQILSLAPADLHLLLLLHILRVSHFRLFQHFLCIPAFPESVFKSQVDPGASALEPTTPTAGGISSPKAQCMGASKEICQCYIDVPLAPSVII